MELENLNKRIQLLTNENNRLYSKLKTQQRKNTRLRSVLRQNGVRYQEVDKNISTRELIVENDDINETNENISETSVVQEVIVESTEGSDAGTDGSEMNDGDGNISDNWEDTSIEFSRNL